MSREPLVPHLEDLTSVKVVGLGGVGTIVARYLVIYLAASGAPVRVVLIDGDAFEPRNAERMAFSRCGNKAAVVCDDLIDLTADSAVTLSAVEEYVTKENQGRLLVDGDVVLLAVDNHATRKLVGGHCLDQLSDVCLISGGNDGVGTDAAGQPQRGTFGNVQIHRRRGGVDESPPLDAYHPEIADPRDDHPAEISCSEALMHVPQILFANIATASALLSAFYLQVCRVLDYPEVCFDVAEARMRPLPLPWPIEG